MLMSVVRTERMGPTGLASLDWYTAASLVIPPSTCSSNTTSASMRPDCGRASLALSIFTTSATLVALAGSSRGSPVRGARVAVGAAVVVVVGSVAVTDGTVLVAAVPLLQPPTSARAATTKEVDFQRMDQDLKAL